MPQVLELCNGTPHAPFVALEPGLTVHKTGHETAVLTPGP